MNSSESVVYYVAFFHNGTVYYNCNLLLMLLAIIYLSFMELISDTISFTYCSRLFSLIFFYYFFFCTLFLWALVAPINISSVILLNVYLFMSSNTFLKLREISWKSVSSVIFYSWCDIASIIVYFVSVHLIPAIL